MESNCAKRSGPFVALLFRNPARSPGLLYQKPRTGLFPPFSAYPRRGPCPLRHLAARSSARSTRPPRGPHRAWRFRPRRSGPNPLGDVLGGVAGVEVDPREHDHMQVGQVGGRHCPIAIFLSRRAPSMAMPRPHARPFRSGRTAAFAESSWRGVAPNGKVGFRIAGCLSWRDRAVRVCSHWPLPRQKSRTPKFIGSVLPGGRASYGGDPVLAWQ